MDGDRTRALLLPYDAVTQAFYTKRPHLCTPDLQEGEVAFVEVCDGAGSTGATDGYFTAPLRTYGCRSNRLNEEDGYKCLGELVDRLMF